ncbi:helix-turn-helix domain-containing protein [Geminocystis sp. GBBB08]|uniref:helix-turn-helix domain-containing protein n=1 Tax=Geminocystis sp. GBBB08 TaxID=2604140 RepID=UPI0027E273CE|nr:helix-turn-helix domain-containing protein [Geminocystis sp. GBBB08]MBL1210484.1 helix-turn-helix domain-containing protein [Geminocystis sp. GBBB08]
MIATIEKEATEYAHLLEMLPPDEHLTLVSSIAILKKNITHKSLSKGNKGDRLIKKLTNNCSYSPAEKIELELETLQRYFERRRELLSNCFTTTQVAKLLGTSRQTPHDRVKNKSLLAVRDNGQWKFPIWQFNPEGADGVIDGLPEVLKNLSINSEFSILNWFMRPNTVLDGLTPVEALKRGLKTRVIAEAMGVGGASW